MAIITARDVIEESLRFSKSIKTVHLVERPEARLNVQVVGPWWKFGTVPARVRDDLEEHLIRNLPAHVLTRVIPWWRKK